MKKKKMKLSLNKIEISNLQGVRGGNGTSTIPGCQETISRNFLDLCCPFVESNGCANTQLIDCRTLLNETTCGLDCEYKNTFGTDC
jgi:hypothetical protein